MLLLKLESCEVMHIAQADLHFIMLLLKQGIFFIEILQVNDLHFIMLLLKLVFGHNDFAFTEEFTFHPCVKYWIHIFSNFQSTFFTLF